MGPIGFPSGGSQNASATKNSRSGRYSITVPWNVPPSLPSISSENSVGSHSTAYAPSTRGTVTDLEVCHHALSAVGSKNAHITRDGAATIVIDEVKDGFISPKPAPCESDRHGCARGPRRSPANVRRCSCRVPCAFRFLRSL